ncbi:hypothetical protein G7074_25810 [Pedobacter sp. HDW13]|uniref:hypothetical protein n=1 Tax=Pedobacter sp. HDW13 TaxID=2714940 RepID=UPI0014083631|nr:hypothetical protein [Pedobacter sp. HDW13]QIL42375.1 hypothetical protein G7074_25810 [Pedobacter sp. HDW13]
MKEGDAGKEQAEFIKQARSSRSLNDDLAVYLYILFPVSLDFSLRILSGDLKKEYYQTSIDSLFDPGKYNVVDLNEFNYAKSIFEKIMLDGLDYPEFIEMHNKQESANKDFIYVIACFLLSTFSDSSKAADLQLANLVTLDATFKNTITSFYNFQLIPYFEQFWSLKFNNNTKDFLKADDLRERGFPLIKKTPASEKIKKIFFVLSCHLKIALSEEIERFIEL